MPLKAHGPLRQSLPLGLCSLHPADCLTNDEINCLCFFTFPALVLLFLSGNVLALSLFLALLLFLVPIFVGQQVGQLSTPPSQSKNAAHAGRTEVQQRRLGGFEGMHDDHGRGESDDVRDEDGDEVGFGVGVCRTDGFTGGGDAVVEPESESDKDACAETVSTRRNA
jgi:hypothetical protein